MADTEPPHVIGECIALLQATPLELSYLAEGNANVIYNVKPKDPKLAMHDHCCVMRLRKDLPFTKPAIEVLSAFKARVVPLYTPDHENLLLEQALYKLDEGTTGSLTAMLTAMERDQKPNRPEKRRHVYHPSIDDEPHGVLMPNLNRGTGTRLLEFKPKWLVQSPSAPSEARRCRTCALNAKRRAEGKSPGRGDSGFCPWDLLSHDKAVLSNALETLDLRLGGEQLADEFARKVQPALFHHRKLEEQSNEVGLEDFRHPEGKGFSLAMALRDCSVFLVVDSDTPQILDVKFADLDLKTADGGKLSHWAQMEESLITCGAYLQADAICALSRPSPSLQSPPITNHA